jgi:hypothetical protein
MRCCTSYQGGCVDSPTDHWLPAHRVPGVSLQAKLDDLIIVGRLSSDWSIYPRFPIENRLSKGTYSALPATL